MIDSVDPGAGNAIADLKRPRRARAAAPVDLAKLDRLPPHSIEAEQGVLGCVLLDPSTGLPACIEKFKGGKEVFYDLRHQALYEVLVEMSEAREAIDLITVQQRLKDKGMLEAVGGVAYLGQLQDAVPSAANLGYYAEIVREKRLLRNLLQTATGVISRIYETEADVDEFVDQVEAELLRAGEERVESSTQGIKDLVHKAIQVIEDQHTNKGMLTGLSTGFPDLDNLTTGLHGGEMIVIAARPSVGKTSLAMNIAECVCIEQGQPVGVFSLEMPAEQLVLRMLCSRARVNLRDIRSGFLVERDFPKLTTAAGKLGKAPLFIDDSSGLSILQLRAKARRMHQQYGVKLFVVDYLQLLHSTARRADNRQQEIADISNGVKALAKELNVPVIVLAQLNRESEREKREPRLSDLRESGAIEQDADLVALLYRDLKDKKDGEDEEDAGHSYDGLPVNLLVAKQRNGPAGEIVRLTFLKGFTRFESRADDKISPHDRPTDH